MIKKLVQAGNGFNLPIGLPVLRIMKWIPSLIPISEIPSPNVKITLLDGKSLLLELATEEEIQQNEKLVNNLYRRESETTNSE